VPCFTTGCLYQSHASSAGYAQLCHGGLETDGATLDSFQRLLSSPDEQARCCVSSQSSFRCNLQWGDFSGVAIHGGVVSSSRGYTHDIEGTRQAIAKLDVRCVFRGHQVRRERGDDSAMMIN
jgi:hypothetical protein